MKTMKTRNKRRKDHFVPESYLRGFTNYESKFYVWEKLASKPIDYMYPAQNCWLDHYYEIDPNDLKRKIGEVESDFIERYAFKLYEDHIQDISKVFTYRPEKIPIDIFLYLCQGYILQKIRVPAYEKGIKGIEVEQGENIKRGSIAKTRAELRKDDPRFDAVRHLPGFDEHFTDEYWKKITQEFIKRPIDTRSTQHHSIIDTVNNMGETPNIALGRLSMMHLTVYNAPDNAVFFTSDNPGFSLVPDEHNPVLKAVNFSLDKMLAVLFPINSKQALFFHFYGEHNTEFIERDVNNYDASFEDVFTINEDTFGHADEKIFCSDKKYLKWFIDQISLPLTSTKS